MPASTAHQHVAYAGQTAEGWRALGGDTTVMALAEGRSKQAVIALLSLETRPPLRAFSIHFDLYQCQTLVRWLPHAVVWTRGHLAGGGRLQGKICTRFWWPDDE